MTAPDYHDDDAPAGASIRWVSFFALTVVLLTIGCVCSGCVSPGEIQAVRDELAIVKGQLATVRERNAEMVKDAAESRACWEAILEWFDAEENRLRRKLLEGK